MMINKMIKFQRVATGISFSFLYIGILGFLAVFWIQYYFGDIQWEQILLNLTQPLQGVAMGLVISGVGLIGILGLVFAAVIYYLIQSFSPHYQRIVASLMGSLFLLYPMIHWNVYDFILSRMITSTLYEEEHVVPEIQTNGRNLILIVLESYEKSFQNETILGQNLSPYLSRIQSENTSFSGFYQLRQTSWTITSLMSSFCGVPLKLNNMFVDLSMYRSFIPGLSCWPAQLKEQGYQTVLMKAASIQFTGTDRFALQHGFQKAVGYRELKDTYGYVAKSHWGLNDHQFYQAVKDELLALSQTGKPFLLATVQVDTHNPTGFLNETCQAVYHDFRDAVICSDKEAGKLIQWIQKQSFYPNTTIIVMGDHLTPNTDIDSYMEKIPEREIYLTVINPSSNKTPYTHTFTNLDVAPTILDAVGFEFDGRYGLGRSLFRPDKTLIETKKDRLEFELDCISEKYCSWGNTVPLSVFEDAKTLDVFPIGQAILFSNGLNQYFGVQDIYEAALGQVWLKENKGEMKLRLNDLPENEVYEISLRLYVPLNGAKRKSVNITIQGERVLTKEYEKLTGEVVKIQILPKHIQNGIVHLVFNVFAEPQDEHRYDGIQFIDMRINKIQKK